MIPTKFKVVDIDAIVMGTRYQHAVLIYEPKEQVLSYPAVWLSGIGGYKTGVEYAKILQRFCGYLAQCPFSSDEEMLLSFWRYITVDTIKAWKSHRIQKKYRESKISPSNETIDREARIVSKFLDWVKFDKGLNTLWDGNRKIIKKAKAIHNDFLKGIAEPREKEVVAVNTRVSICPDNKDYPLEGLARKRQGHPHEYLHDEQISTLIHAFPDKVYKYISLAGYVTGLRDAEVLAVPYWHTYVDGTVFTSDPNLIMERLNEKVMILKVLGKGKKLRNVKVGTEAWLKIMESWAPLYFERKKKYENRTGQALPLNILWLDKSGYPIYCSPQDDREHYKPVKMLQDAFIYISKKHKKDPLSVKWSRSVNYYCFRHTFATNYVLTYMEARKERDRDQYIEDISLRKDLADQMGHSFIDTTFSHYIDNAIVIIKNREAGNNAHTFPNFEDLLKQK